jgi:hypothetical protein
VIKAADKDLHDDDLLQMVNAGLIPATGVGQETVTYVDNVYKYYIAYKLALEQKALQESPEHRAK